jgi:hypothetical protein
MLFEEPASLTRDVVVSRMADLTKALRETLRQ